MGALLRARNRQRPASDPPAAGSAGDREAVARAQADRQAFAELYRRHFDGVYRFCLARLGDPAAAEDAASQVFAKALAALPRFRDRGPDDGFRAWLFRIAHNVVIDDVRARRRHDPLAAADELVDHGDPPEDAVIRGEDREVVLALVAALPVEQRRVVELRLAGLSGAEISSVLGRSRGAIDTAQCRAVARLRVLARSRGLPVPSGAADERDR